MTRVLSAVAWPYTNGPRHIGHVAGFGVPSDVFSRFMRMAGPRRADGQRHRRARHADPGARRQRGRARRASWSTSTTRSSSTTCAASGLSYDLFTRTTTGNHYSVVQEMFETCRRNGYMVEETTKTAISPSTGRTLPDRYIEGTCPICGYTERARRPVRQLRQPARRDRADRPAVEDQRRDAGVPRHPALVPRPAGARRGAGGVARPARGDRPVAPQRHQVQPEHPQGDPAARDDARHRLGHPGAGLGGPADQAALRLVRRGHRLPLGLDRVGPAPGRARARTSGASGGTTPTRSPTTSWARTTSSSTPRSGRPSCWPTTGRGDKGGEPGTFGTLNLPTEVVSSEFLTFGDSQFSTSRGNVIYVGDFLARYGADALRYYICAAGPETSDAAFTWADFVTRNNSELVAGWGNLVNRTATMIAKSFGEIPTAGPLEEVDEQVLATVRDGFDTVGEPHREAPAARRGRRGDAHRRRGEQVPHGHRALQDEGRVAARAPGHGPARRRAVRERLQHPALAVPAARRQQGARRRSAARATLMPMPRIEQVDELEPDNGAGHTSYSIITGDYTATPAWESAAAGGRARPVDKPTPVFTKLDPSVVEEELRPSRRWVGSRHACRPRRRDVPAPLRREAEAHHDDQPLRDLRVRRRRATRRG